MNVLGVRSEDSGYLLRLVTRRRMKIAPGATYISIFTSRKFTVFCT